MNNNIGLHIRLNDSLTEVINKAIRLNIPFFQTFVITTNGKYITLDEQDVNNFLKLRRERFNDLFLHGSYWINLCGNSSYRLKTIQKELTLAKKLEFTHLILHPGAASGCTKEEGLDNLARALNKLLKTENDVQIVLENTAHGKNSIGGDFFEFHKLLEKIDHPEKLFFCIDTAHAYSFGYDLSNSKEQENFISLVDSTIGINKIKLIHLNDTLQDLGLKIDRHHIPGQGKIGEVALKQFIKNPHFEKTAVLMELPILSEDKEKSIIKKILTWK